MLKDEEEKNNNSVLRFFKLIYIKIFSINDAPQRIALGLGIGIFCGILPGTGLLAALFLAFILRVNRAAALLGSLATNTWLSVATFLLSIKIGSAILRLSWQDVLKSWVLFLENFHWLDLLKSSILKIILPVIAGYFVVAFCLGLIVYLITLIILKYADKGRIHLSR